MGLAITEKFRMTAGGRAWRCFDVTHVGSGANSSITAGSIDLTYIEGVIGVNTNIAVQAAPGSVALGMLDISISAKHDKLVWVASTVAGYQTITVVGW